MDQFPWAQEYLQGFRSNRGLCFLICSSISLPLLTGEVEIHQDQGSSESSRQLEMPPPPPSQHTVEPQEFSAPPPEHDAPVTPVNSTQPQVSPVLEPQPQSQQPQVDDSPGKIYGPRSSSPKLISLSVPHFPLTTIKTYMEKPMGKGSGKRESATYLCAGRYPFTSPTFTRTNMIKLIYTEFGVEAEYVVGVESGPPFKAWFTGMEYVVMFGFTVSGLMCCRSGGKERAGMIESDANWAEFQSRLCTARRKDKTVFVSLDMEAMVPYRRSRQSRVCWFGDRTNHFSNHLSYSFPQVKVKTRQPRRYNSLLSRVFTLLTLPRPPKSQISLRIIVFSGQLGKRSQSTGNVPPTVITKLVLSTGTQANTSQSTDLG